MEHKEEELWSFLSLIVNAKNDLKQMEKQQEFIDFIESNYLSKQKVREIINSAYQEGVFEGGERARGVKTEGHFVILEMLYKRFGLDKEAK